MWRALLTSLAVGIVLLVGVGLVASPSHWSVGANYALLAGVIAIAVPAGVLRLPPSGSRETRPARRRGKQAPRGVA